MKALLSVQNIQERQTIKGLLNEFKEVVDARTPVETVDILCRSADLDFVILDERSGKCLQALETLALIHSQNPPVVLVLVDERNSTGLTGWKPESERLNSYSELGAELFLHRPFGLGELKNKVTQALTWVQSLPSWVQLMRVSRIYLKNQQADKILAGLEVMTRKMPEDLNINLLYAKALIGCQKPRYQDACEFLKKLGERIPSCPPIIKLLTNTYLAMNDPIKASFSALDLANIHPSEENWKGFWEIFNQWIAPKNPDFKTLNQYFLAVAGRNEKTREMRRLIYQRMVAQAQTIVQVTALINHYEQFTNALQNTQAETERLIEVTERYLDENPEDIVGLRNIGLLLERMLDQDPSNARFLENYVIFSIKTGTHAQAEARLRRARVSGHKGFEYHISASRLALARSDVETARREASHAQSHLNTEVRRRIFSEVLSQIQAKQSVV